jgi:hypothetical protein
MKMMNFLHDAARANERMTQLMHEASINRLLPAKSSMTDQLLTTVGTWMITTGERLTRMSAPETHDKKLRVIETA